MRRQIWNLLTVMSAGLLIAAIGCWMQSQFKIWHFVVLGSPIVSLIGATTEEYAIGAVTFMGGGLVGFSHQLHEEQYLDLGIRWQFGHFGLGVSASQRYFTLMLPFWFLALLFSIFPTLWCYKRWRRRTCNPRCDNCGYDLKGSVGKDACPECGQRINVPHAARRSMRNVMLRIINIIVLLSALSLAATLAIWARSHFLSPSLPSERHLYFSPPHAGAGKYAFCRLTCAYSSWF